MKRKIIDDLGGMVSGLGIAAQGAREEIEQAVRGRVDAMLAENGLVSREEFEAVREMAVVAREENSQLSEQIKQLRADLEASQKAK
ncbi:MAG: accessory factor UbiK family protein [Rhodobiaceae bacterium]|nr:accessory factor UbiK family protein [Rhodobiaceae bacterium]